MFTPNALIKMLSSAQEALGMNSREVAEKAGIDPSYWNHIQAGRRRLSLEMLPHLAKAVDLSFQAVASHHEPFTQLTEEEATALLKLADHYKRNGPQHPHPLRTAVEKLTGK